ncbi:MAG: hypothetical protein ACRDQ4_08490 [Pseudonocardiaceae bacterium]
MISAGHAFVQNLRRGHYELGVEEPTTLRAAAFDELALAISPTGINISAGTTGCTDPSPSRTAFATRPTCGNFIVCGW